MKEWNTIKDTKCIQPEAATRISEPHIVRFLFADTRMAWLWLTVCVYVGWEKLTGYSISIGSFVEASKGGPRVFSGHDGFQR